MNEREEDDVNERKEESAVNVGHLPGVSGRRRTMTSLQSNEERNRLRLQAWKQRNQESSPIKQHLENAPLFGQPFKTNKGDDLSNRIQRMLGSFDDNLNTEPLTGPSPSTFPSTNCPHPASDPPGRSLGDSGANPSLRVDFNSPKCQKEKESQASTRNSPLSHLSRQKHHEKPSAADVQQHSCSHSLERPSPEEAQFTTPDELQYHRCTTSGSSPGIMQFCSRGTSPPFNRTFNMSHSQAFNPPLSYKQTSAAMMQKPTAYVRPMDGPDVVTESPEVQPSPKHCPRLPDIMLSKPIQGKGSTLPQFLETLTSEINGVEHILSEMTCSWPPLLSGINSPCVPKTQSSVRVMEENSPKDEIGQVSSEPSLSHQSLSVDLEPDRQSGPVSNSPQSEPAPVFTSSADWQLDKLTHFNQQNYRSKSHLSSSQSPKPSSLKDGFKQSSVSVFSPARDTSHLNQKAANLHGSQQSGTSEKSDSTSSSLGSPLHSNSGKHIPVEAHGTVSVHFERTLSQEPGLKEKPKVKTEGRHRKQSKSSSVALESGVTHLGNGNKKALKSDNTSSDQTAQASIKLKAETKLKKVASLSQKDKRLSGCSQESNKDTLSLIVKINLNLLQKIPQTSGSRCSKDDKPQLNTNRKNDKGDQYCPKKKPKLQGDNLSVHMARPENSAQSKATRKGSKKKDEIPLTTSGLKDCSQKNQKSIKHNQYCGDGPQLNTKEIKSPNSPKKSSGKITEQSSVKKSVRESSSNRPLLKAEDRNYPVKHYIKEAKRLKHKADAEMDKLRKIFHYLHGACFFIESGIAMERDPQISMSSYTMFAETVELIKFVLKLTISEDPTPTENDILALCLKCQALLQMTMFRTKEKTAVSYSKTLIDHFISSSQCPPDPSSLLKTPALPSNPVSSSALCGSAAAVSDPPSGSTVVPQDIGHVALTYVNITTLFLKAHDLWEQAEEFASKGSGLLTELNRAVGDMSLTSTMSSVVRYIRQGLHWLQMDGRKVK